MTCRPCLVYVQNASLEQAAVTSAEQLATAQQAAKVSICWERYQPLSWQQPCCLGFCKPRQMHACPIDRYKLTAAQDQQGCVRMLQYMDDD
jgi:hypothetical protein